jgi:hypothetical protein
VRLGGLVDEEVGEVWAEKVAVVDAVVEGAEDEVGEAGEGVVGAVGVHEQGGLVAGADNDAFREKGAGTDVSCMIRSRASGRTSIWAPRSGSRRHDTTREENSALPQRSD